MKLHGGASGRADPSCVPGRWIEGEKRRARGGKRVTRSPDGKHGRRTGDDEKRMGIGAAGGRVLRAGVRHAERDSRAGEGGLARAVHGQVWAGNDGGHRHSVFGGETAPVLKAGFPEYVENTSFRAVRPHTPHVLLQLILTLDENGSSEPQWSLRSAAVPAACAVIIEVVPS